LRIRFRFVSGTSHGDLGVNRSRMEQVRGLVGEKLSRLSAFFF
jgi:uncharacterized protein (DUF1499 family)